MHRFYSKNPGILNGNIIISDKETFHYIKNVLRIKKGQRIIIFDGNGNEYTVAVDNISAGEISAKIVKKQMKMSQAKRFIAIACALPKKSRIEEIIDKLTQLGVDMIIPMETERSIVRLDNVKKTARLNRWIKIAINASRQSSRSIVPVIKPLMSFQDVLDESGGFDIKLIPTLDGERIHIKKVLNKDSRNNILVLIGPEGDFSPAEIKKAKSMGFLPISLGELVLRVETAAIAVAGYLKFALE